MKTKFPYLMWHWTCANENLFDLDRDALRWYALFINEASKHHPQP